MLHEDLSLTGSLAALLTVAALLAAVITCGVAVSAMANSTVLGIAVLWVAVYGAGFALSFLAKRVVSPTWLLQVLPNVLHGNFDWHTVGRLAGWSGLTCGVAAVVGMAYFSRRDV